MLRLLATILSGLAIGAALVFGLFLVGGAVLPSAPIMAFALLFGLFFAWESEPAERPTNSRRGCRNGRQLHGSASRRAVIS